MDCFLIFLKTDLKIQFLYIKNKELHSKFILRIFGFDIRKPLYVKKTPQHQVLASIFKVGIIPYTWLYITYWKKVQGYN